MKSKLVAGLGLLIVAVAIPFVGVVVAPNFGANNIWFACAVAFVFMFTGFKLVWSATPDSEIYVTEYMTDEQKIALVDQLMKGVTVPSQSEDKGHGRGDKGHDD